MIEMGKNKQYDGYATDLVTDLSLEWLEERDKDKPFFLMCHHKAPHRNWEPDDKHAHMYADIEIPEPITFQDDYSTRSRAAKEAAMRIENDRSEEHTSELQSRFDIVCSLLLEKQ